MPSKIDGKILEHATKSFAARGYHGTTTKEIAVAANVTEGSLFRLFQSKDNLFQQVLKSSVADQMTPEEFGELLSRDGLFGEVVSLAIRRWYSNIKPDYLRLFNYATLTDAKLVQSDAAPRIREIVRLLATKVDRHHKRRPVSKFALVNSQQLFYGLAWHKMTRDVMVHNGGISEREVVSLALEGWLRAVDSRVAR